MYLGDYEINLSEEQLDLIIKNDACDVDLLKPSTDEYRNLPEPEKQALKYLTYAAKSLNYVYLALDNQNNIPVQTLLTQQAETSSYAEKLLWLFNSINGVSAYNKIDKEPVCLLKGVKIQDKKNFYPDNLGNQEFQNILNRMLDEGKDAEVQKILSCRTIVKRKGDELQGIDYVDYFRPYFLMTAGYLRKAASFLNKDELFTKYLLAQADAFSVADEAMTAKAEVLWSQMQDTKLEFTVSRENYDDMFTPAIMENRDLTAKLKAHGIVITPKDSLGIRVGIVNRQGTDMICRFKELMPELAQYIPYNDIYQQHIKANSDLKQTMADVDIVALSGHFSAVRGGVWIAQNLPNNDKLSLTMGGGRRNVYHRQLRSSLSVSFKEAINNILAPELMPYDTSDGDHIFVIGHENGHSFGPDSSYQYSIGMYKHVIEELKANMVSLVLMPHYVKAGVISEHNLQEVYISAITRTFLPAEPALSAPHQLADLITFNYLTKCNAMSFNQNHRLEVDFKALPSVFYDMLSKTVKLQLDKSPAKAREFIETYSAWGEQNKYIASVREKAGIKRYKTVKQYIYAQNTNNNIQTCANIKNAYKQNSNT